MAARSVNLGAVIKAARLARGWTQVDLADALHRSPSTVSRWESGKQRLTDIDELRVVADVLRIPYEDLGLAVTLSGDSTAKDDDPVRRRQLLRNLAMTAAATAAPGGLAGAGVQPNASGDLLVANLRDALLASPSHIPAPRSDVAAALALAKRAFQACRYERLAVELPRLITRGTSLSASGESADCALLAEIYTLATRMLVKLDRTELGLVAADRARNVAAGAADPILPAEAARNLSVLTRKAGWHDRAAEIALSAAVDPRLRGEGPRLKAQRGLLIMSAAYTAAKGQNRSGMRELTGEAMSIAITLGDTGVDLSHGTGFGTWMVDSHLVSAHNACGDPAAALAVARRIDLRALPTVERRSRFLGDVATAHAMRGNRTECLEALLKAEHIAPEETHARPAIRALVGGLLTSGRVTPELRGLAARCGVT
ncbi:helix-turn-helix domain-containing protein [Bailinhaonella thermotolerans]|uniref:XRE family transcriptional regulator n=1 Tax=Bailinhaonella thermotolerans TaxID=1070861 RepID=A0A3A4A5X8_9ACTN|nr:helix-turn-helix transcriptional regulator [Bailinhaonella thermotolerans]RJL23965.1 XRE family transcriptional regulator [Bailinhaonella thermotolerans]